MRWLALLAALLACSSADARPGRDRVRMRAPSYYGVVFSASFATPGCIASPVADTGQAITVTRASTRTCNAGALTCQNNELCVEADGALIEPGRTNLFLNSATPANQNISVSASTTYTAWVTGTGSIDFAAGTATATSGLPCTASAGSNCTIVINGAGTISATVTGTLTHAQVEAGTYATSKIVVVGTPVARAADVVTVAVPSGLVFATADYSAAMTVKLIADLPGSGNWQVAFGSNSNYMPMLRLSTGAASPISAFGDNGTGSADVTVPSKTSGRRYWLYRSGGVLYADAEGSTARSTRTLGTIPSEPTTLYLGGHNSNAAMYLGGYVKSVCVGRRSESCR